MNAQIPAYIGGIIRIITSLAGGYLINNGLSTEADIEQLSGAAILITTAIWSIIAKRRALATPPEKAGLQILIILIPALFLFSGCASDKQVESAAGWARDYYNQPNTAEIIMATGTNVQFCITGASQIKFSCPVPTKSIIPRDPTWTESFFDTLKTIAPWAVMGWMIHDSGGIGSNNSRTTTTTTTP